MKGVLFYGIRWLWLETRSFASLMYIESNKSNEAKVSRSSLLECGGCNQHCFPIIMLKVFSKTKPEKPRLVTI